MTEYSNSGWGHLPRSLREQSNNATYVRMGKDVERAELMDTLFAVRYPENQRVVTSSSEERGHGVVPDKTDGEIHYSETMSADSDPNLQREN